MLKQWLAYRLLIESIRRDGFPILPAKAAQEACEMVKVIEGFYRSGKTETLSPSQQAPQRELP